MGIGNKLHQRRLELGLTLEQVGQIVGVSKSTVRKWETGYIENMKRDKIALLAQALQVSPAYIMEWDEEITNHINNAMILSNHETTVMQAYREQPAMQPAVDKLLGVAADEKNGKEKIQPAESGKSVSLPVNPPEEKSSETDANPDEGIRVFRAVKSINNDQPPQIVTLTKEQAELLDNTPFIDLDI